MATRSKSVSVEIFLVSFAGLLLEISYTRIFSFKAFYYFTYLLIGIALLGFGSGGVFVTLLPRLRNLELSRLIPWCCTLGGISVGFGYVLIARLTITTMEIFTNAREALNIVLMSASLYVPFLCIGIVLASVFAQFPQSIQRLYFVDLLGAGLACAVVLKLILVLTPPGCVYLAGTVLAAAGLRMTWRSFRPMLAAALPVTGILLIGVLYPAYGIDVLVDTDKKDLGEVQGKPERILFSSWSPVFRVDVVAHPQLGEWGRLLTHDGLLGSAFYEFDGDISKFSRFEGDARSYPFVMAKEHPEVLIIGAAGGHEILASLYFGAKHVTGVELNPVTVSLLTEYFAEYTGNLPAHPKVTYLNDEGRSFLARQEQDYDLIYFVAPDSYSAMNAATAGAFVMTESYL